MLREWQRKNTKLFIYTVEGRGRRERKKRKRGVEVCYEKILHYYILRTFAFFPPQEKKVCWVSKYFYIEIKYSFQTNWSINWREFARKTFPYEKSNNHWSKREQANYNLTTKEKFSSTMYKLQSFFFLFFFFFTLRKYFFLYYHYLTCN